MHAYMAAEIPPPPLPDPQPASGVKSALSGFLSLTLAVFFAGSALALTNDTLIVLGGNHSLAGAAAAFGVIALLMTLAVYGLMGLTPMVPKRFFLPVTLCGLLTAMAALPLLIYFYKSAAWIVWGMSLAQFMVVSLVIRRLAGSWKPRWPLISTEQLGSPGFRWGNLIGFAAVNLLVAVPAVVLYVAGCGVVAVSHFTEDFVALRPSGVTMQVRTYTRDDGKTVVLVPMSHIGEEEFYRNLAASFPPTATVLMEGVSDKGNVLDDKVGYGKTAKDLGLAEQQAVFRPQGELVPADVDLSQFSKTSLDYLKKSMAIHTQGINPVTLPLLLESPPPDLPEKLLHDLLTLRNAHLLRVMEEKLLTSDHVIVPWGAAHMPGISAGVLKAGFRLQDTEDHVAIRFGKR
ncbi:MAG: hypothetical protein EOP85_03715 [Verrucomicrobiaceae bacterium]|nr:MAG: hypothetical protein EOP85_03715 [Verrucomicrobiaceae bacterium]